MRNISLSFHLCRQPRLPRWKNSSRSGKSRPRLSKTKKFKSIWKVTTTPFENKKYSSRSGKLKAGRTNSSKTAMSFREDLFQRRLHFREDWLCRTFSIRKWRVNVFIISEKIGYSGERFRSGNEEWMYSSFQRRLVTLENVFIWEMKSECIQTYYVTC